LSAPTNNQIYVLPANQFSPSAGTTLAQYHKKHGTKKVAKKNLEKEKDTHKYNTCKICEINFTRIFNQAF